MCGLNYQSNEQYDATEDMQYMVKYITWKVKEKLEMFIRTDFAQSFISDAFLYP